MAGRGDCRTALWLVSGATVRVGFSGEPMEQRLVPIEKMIGWSFYPDTDAMMSGSQRSLAQDSGAQAARQEPRTLASRF
jgi:hypothetical protein